VEREVDTTRPTVVDGWNLLWKTIQKLFFCGLDRAYNTDRKLASSNLATRKIKCESSTRERPGEAKNRRGCEETADFKSTDKA
jgi:hypothetical protein